MSGENEPIQAKFKIGFSRNGLVLEIEQPPKAESNSPGPGEEKTDKSARPLNKSVATASTEKKSMSKGEDQEYDPGWVVGKWG